MGPEANVLHSAVRISSWLFWTVDLCLCLSSAQQFSPFPVRAITYNRPGSADAWITIRVRRWWVCCVLNCIEVHLAVWLQGETLQTKTLQNWCIWLWCTFVGRCRHFCSEWQWQFARTQMALLTHTSHSGLAVKTVDLLYLYSTGLQAVQVGYVRELLHIRTDPSALSVLTARQGRQASSISHLKIIDTRHNRH